MSELKTLRQLWSEQAQTPSPRPLKVVSNNGSVAVIMGLTLLMDTKDERAYGYLLESSRMPSPPTMYNRRAREEHAARTKSGIERMQVFEADRPHWKLWAEPKPLPHWPAVRRSQRSTQPNAITLTSVLYHSEEVARAGLGADFIRLAKEYPAIEAVPGAAIGADTDVVDFE